MVISNRSIEKYFVSLVLAGFLLFAGTMPAPAQHADAKPVTSPPFVMPLETRLAGIDGTLTLLVSVDKSGSVKNVRVLAGPGWPCNGPRPGKEIDIVREAVRNNMLKAKFSPQMKNGKPRAAELLVTFALGADYSDALAERTAQLIDGGVVNGKALTLPRPEYPATARSKRVSGAASVRVIIDTQGKVVSAGVVQGHELLQDAAREAACRAKFAPTTLDGIPVRVKGVITYNFVP